MALISRPKLVSAMVAFGCCLLAASPVLSQSYPRRPIMLVVPFAAGGGNDIVARVIAEKVSRTLGQQVVVENRPGAAGTIGTLQVAKSAPDGYVLGLGSNATLAIAPAYYPNAGYNPLTSFSPVGLIATSPLVLMVNPVGSGAFDSGADRACEKGTGTADLWLRRQRLPCSSHRSVICEASRNQADPCPLPRDWPSDHRSRGRPCHHGLQPVAAHGRAHQGWNASGAGGFGRGPLVGLSRDTNDCRVRAERVRVLATLRNHRSIWHACCHRRETKRRATRRSGIGRCESAHRSRWRGTCARLARGLPYRHRARADEMVGNRQTIVTQSAPKSPQCNRTVPMSEMGPVPDIRFRMYCRGQDLSAAQERRYLPPSLMPLQNIPRT